MQFASFLRAILVLIGAAPLCAIGAIPKLALSGDTYVLNEVAYTDPVAGCKAYLATDAVGAYGSVTWYGGYAYWATMYGGRYIVCASSPRPPTQNQTGYQFDWLLATSPPYCPSNSTVATSTLCNCNAGYVESAKQTSCVAPSTVVINLKQSSKDVPSCKSPGFGDPIFPLTGTERMSVDTGLVVGGYPLVLTYDTAQQKAAMAAGVLPKDFGDAASFGGLWMSNLHRKLAIGVGEFGVNAHRGDGHIESFKFSGGVYSTDSDNAGQLTVTSSGYQLVHQKAKTIEKYNATGQLMSLTDFGGGVLSYGYSDASTLVSVAPALGYLIQITDPFGRNLRFEYTVPSGGNAATDARISKIFDVSGNTILASYDAAGNLAALTWADGKTRQFLYENVNLNWALTGIIDENSKRYATVGYDNNGNAISSELAGGVERYSTTYVTAPTLAVTQSTQSGTGFTENASAWTPPTGVVVTGPTGSVSVLSSNSVLGNPFLTGTTQPAGSGCAASNNATTFDIKGNISSQDDFQGQRTCFAYDTSNRETVRVEGLANTAVCSTVLPMNAVLPSGARKISTAWHPDWRMPTVVSAPGSITTNIYHGQPDTFNGNAVANCTSAALMPNAKPLPLLCKQVVQATLSSGALDTGVANLVNQYTYDVSGRVLSSTDSLNRSSANVYYSNTAFTGVAPNETGHTVGDLQSITNAAGHITTFTQYDRAGRIRQSTDPKGVVTDITYTPRGWTSSVTVTPPGGTARVTSYTYDFAGQLIGVATPDGASLSYTYDDAHRLVGVQDAKGNSVVYTLDNMGNRIAEQIKDPTGTLQRSINRSFDALNRVQQVTGAAQ